jgi:hypothetical protein
LFSKERQFLLARLLPHLRPSGTLWVIHLRFISGEFTQPPRSRIMIVHAPGAPGDAEVQAEPDGARAVAAESGPNSTAKAARLAKVLGSYTGETWNGVLRELDQAMPNQTVSADQALQIAQADAARAYRELTHYNIRLALEPDGWHIDYELKDSGRKGGGPHYLIHAATGEILKKRCEQ